MQSLVRALTLSRSTKLIAITMIFDPASVYLASSPVIANGLWHPASAAGWLGLNCRHRSQNCLLPWFLTILAWYFHHPWLLRFQKVNKINFQMFVWCCNIKKTMNLNIEKHISSHVIHYIFSYIKMRSINPKYIHMIAPQGWNVFPQ